MAFARQTSCLLLIALLLGGCGAEPATDESGMVSLPDISKQTTVPDDEETETPTPTPTPTSTKKPEVPKVLGIKALTPIAAGKSYTIAAVVTAAEKVEWAQVSGPGVVTFSTTSKATTNVTASVEGHYVLSLTATDAAGKQVGTQVDFDWDTTAPTVGPLTSLLTATPQFLNPTVSGATKYTWAKAFGPGELIFSTPNAASTQVRASMDGSYVVRLTAADDAGNTGIRTVNFVWDTTAPGISSMADAYTQSSAYFDPSVTGATTYTWTRVSGPGTITFSAPSAHATIATATVEGSYVLRLTAQDAVGNTTTSDVNFYRDTIPPQITPLPAIYARVPLMVTTPVVGASTYSWSKKSGPGSITFGTPAAAGSIVSALVEGAYVITLKATDLAGNIATQDVSFTWDVTPPVISAMTDIQTRVTATFSPTVTDATTYVWSKVSGPGTLIFSAPNSTSTTVSATVDGTYGLRLTATDDAGNVSTRDVNLVWDTTPPVINVMADVASRTSGALVPVVTGASTFQWVKISGPGALTFDTPTALSTNVTATVDGTYVIRLTATDYVGNSSTRDVNFTYDTVPPVVDPISSILTKSLVTITPTVTGATRYTWMQKTGPGTIFFNTPSAVSSTVSSSMDGSYVITFTAFDAVGNSAARDIAFVWDTTPPTAILGTRPALNSNTLAYNFTVTAAATDFASYKWALIPSVAQCSDATYSSSVTAGTALAGSVPGEGTYFMCVISIDTVGNVQVTPTSYSWTVDITPPTITLATSFDAKAAKALTNTTVGATTYAWTQLSGPGLVTFSNAAAAAPTATANIEGAYVLQLQATDAAGNVATATTTFTWDITPPALTPVTSYSTNTPFTLSPTITGATTYAWTRVSGPTVTFGSAATASTLVTPASDGTCVVRVTATDAALNSAYIDISVIYDTVAPVIPVIAAINTNTTRTISPAVTGANSYAWTKVSGPGTITFGTASAMSTTAAANADGAYVLRLTAQDTAGNIATRDVSFNWDTVAPVITDMPTIVYANAAKLVAPTVTGATTYAWTRTVGTGGFTFSSTTTASTTITGSTTPLTSTIQLVATDAALNATTATAQFVWDTTRPTVALTTPSTTVTGPFTVTATFSEQVQGFDASKITVTKGTAGSVSPASTVLTNVYTFVITPNDTGTPLTVQVPVSAASDQAGNFNSVASNTLSIGYDGVAPVAPEAAAPTASVMVDGIGYNSALVKWFTATDNITATTAIKYYISYSNSSSFDTAVQVMAGTRTAAMVQSAFATYGCYVTPTSGTSLQCSYHLTALTPNTTYYVNIVAEDSYGNQSVYTKGSFTTLNLRPVFRKIAASQSGSNACGLAESGLVYCWGDNSLGALGDGTQLSKTIPTAIDSSNKFIDIAVGTNHACALRDNGNAYCWGAGTNGQIGNSATTMVLSPVQAGSDIYTAIVAGDKFTCGLRDDGRVLCWGNNLHGELANGSTTDTNAPGLISNTGLFRKISAGANHVCAILGDGVIYCWGYNLNGQTGSGTSGAGTNKTAATAVSGSVKFRELAAGYAHSCAIAGNGDVYCWGKGALGQIGNSATTDQSVPTKISGTDKFEQIAVTNQSSCAIRDDGTLRCWGNNSNGELNTAAAQASSSSALTTDSARWISVVGGNSSFCGTKSSGISACWGLNTNSQLGVGDSTARSSAVAISMTNVTTPTFVKWKKVVVGDVLSCGLSTTNDLWCWGYGFAYGELGVGAKIAAKTAPLHIGTSKWLDVSVAANHACAINDAYEVYCWGKNDKYELAAGDVVHKYSPIKISGTKKYHSVAIASTSSCAAGTDGQLQCWGTDASTYYFLGTGTGTTQQVPISSTDVTSLFIKISAGDTHYCGVTADGLGRCWGRNNAGQLGMNSTTALTTVVNFDNATPANKYVAMAPGAQYTCGVTTANAVRCFGLGTSGQLGNGASASSTPGVSTVFTPTKKVMPLSWSGASTDHSCVTTTDHYSYCWGANAQKQTFNSATTIFNTPQQQNSNIVGTSTGTTVSCQLSSQSDISCFGFCDNGRCGQATPGTTDATAAAAGTPVALKVSGI